MKKHPVDGPMEALGFVSCWFSSSIIAIFVKKIAFKITSS